MEILFSGENMKRKEQIKKYGIYLIILILTSISLSGCTNNDEGHELKEKLASEIEYLDTKLVNMLNKVNGITFKNYIVSSEKVESQDTDISSSGGSSAKDSSQTESSGDKSATGSSDSSSENSNQSSGNKQSNKNNTQYKMDINTILSNPKDTDWSALKSDIESLYASWGIVTLDLYKEKVDNQSILNFNTDLDITAKAIKDEDKVATLNGLSKLYSYIPIYNSSFSQDTNKVNIYKTKSNILNAYALIEQNKQDEVNKQLSLAEQNFHNLITNINSDTKNQNTINKTYILLKDIQTSTDPSSKEVFYIKYKNLMEELNILD